MTQQVQEIEPATPAVDPGTPPRAAVGRGLFTSLSRSWTGLIGGIVFALICLLGLIGPYVFDFPNPADPSAIYQWPSGAHWLGTDGSGKDVLKQILTGGQNVIFVGLISASISTVIAVVGGALAAYKGGWFDSFVVQCVDFVLTIPHFAVLVVLAAYLRLSHPAYVAILLGCLGWAGLLRAVRAQVLSLKENAYVEAARLVNLRTSTIVLREIVPNMASYLLISFITGMTGAVYALVGLYLLGIAPMAGTDWGIMLNQAWVRGALFYKGSLFYILSPLMIIAALQLSAIWFSRALEEILNPRLRSEG